MNIVQLIICVVFFLSVNGIDHGFNANQCLPSLPIFENNPGPETVGKGVHAVFSSLVINCNGHITSWKAYTKHRTENTIHFQIWRPVESGLYNLVGENVLFNARPTEELVTLNVVPSDYIRVQIGDVIGLHVGNVNKGVEIKTQPDTNSKMWHYRLNNSPAIGSQIQLSNDNQLLMNKEQIPMIAVSLVEDNSLHIESTSSSSSSSSVMPVPTNTVTSGSNDPIANTDSNSPATQTNNEQSNDETNCDNENESTFPILLVLIMTIAILLLVVFILGTALVVISFKLHHTRDSNNGGGVGTITSGSNKNTFVGKQIVLIEEGKGHHSRKENLKLRNAITSRAAIENPSYVIDDNNQDQTREQATRINNNMYSCNNENNRVVLEEDGLVRERTDSDSTVTTRGFNAQEYEDPQNYSTPQVIDRRPQPTQITSRGINVPRSIYSHPRSFTQRQEIRTVPVECNISYSQPPSIKSASRSALRNHTTHSSIEHV